jgi:chromosomal replication initiator protein
VPAPTDPSAAWSPIAARLRDSLNDVTFATWFGAAEPLEAAPGRLVVGVPNQFTKSWIEGHFGSLLDAAARPDDLAVELRVLVRETRTAAARDVEEPAAPEPPAPADVPAPPGAQSSSAGLNPRYTFDLFVIGASNRFAHAAALAVAESPAQAYNPLFIYGSTGLGKTHLLQAVGHYVLEQHPRLRVRYVTTETVMNEFVDALRDKKTDAFKLRYRTYDLLLVDDIQFIEGKEHLQEEFFHTFNSLYEAEKQIVISSDRPPRQLATLEARLRTRFEWGLITDVQPPDLETRIAILRKKVLTDGIPIAEPALTIVADRASSNIRELEGALTRVIAYASLTGRPATAELAEEVLKDMFPGGAPRPITVEQIQAAVCEMFHLSVADLRGDKRSQAVVLPRHIAMYLSRELTDLSLPKIGARFGGRDHSTVLYAVSNITARIRGDRDLFNMVQELTTRIKRGR